MGERKTCSGRHHSLCISKPDLFRRDKQPYYFERGLSEGAKRTEGEQKGEQKVVGGTKTKTKTETKTKTKGNVTILELYN